MIDPTVARVVHFFPSSIDSEFDRHEAPFAAIIAKVWNDGVVNLMVVNKQGVACGRQHVPLVQEGQLPLDPDAPFCAWMPYQVGQAARSDALVAALSDRIQSLEAKNEFDFEARRWQRRIEALEAREAARSAATTDHPECVRFRQEVYCGQVTGAAVAANGLETALTPTPVGACVATSDLTVSALDPKAI